MAEATPRTHSLVLYKDQPARVIKAGAKLEIELPQGQTKSVRGKDVVLLHQGPLASLSELRELEGEVAVAWELLAGDTTNLDELAELIFEEDSPAASWTAWQWVAEGLYFHGVPERIEARSREELAEVRRARENKAAEKQAWQAFLQRIRSGDMKAEDRDHLQSVARLALKQSAASKVLKDLGRTETPEHAHALLLKLGFWDETFNPYPERLGVANQSAQGAMPALPDEPRLDLTHLTAYAIDDEDSHDPDDAISWDGERLWVHVADVAAMIPCGSELDREAQARGANLYLPEGTVTMLPPKLTEVLALGLRDPSPALSFGLAFHEDGEPRDLVIEPSWISVTRMTYREADEQLADGAFQPILQRTQAFRQRRAEAGAIFLNLPEVKIRVVAGEVVIRPLPRLKSRAMVTDAMLMAGEAAGHFALKNELPFPYATQPPPDRLEQPQTLAAMFAYRKKLKRSQMKTAPEPHAGLGLSVYARATSPLRRYLDLVAHQQLRAHLRGTTVLDSQQMLQCTGAAEAVSGLVDRAERLSNTHWTLVYLRRRPDWRGEGVLVDRRGKRGIVIIPELGLETSLHVAADLPLDSAIPLRLKRVNLPQLTAVFQMESS